MQFTLNNSITDKWIGNGLLMGIGGLFVLGIEPISKTGFFTVDPYSWDRNNYYTPIGLLFFGSGMICGLIPTEFEKFYPDYKNLPETTELERVSKLSVAEFYFKRMSESARNSRYFHAGASLLGAACIAIYYLEMKSTLGNYTNFDIGMAAITGLFLCSSITSFAMESQVEMEYKLYLQQKQSN